MRAASVLLLVVLAACSVSTLSAPSPSPVSTVVPSAAATPTPRATASSAPESASDLLECDGPVSPMGGYANDFGPDGFGDTPDEAFAMWLTTNPFTVPRSGFEPWGEVGDRTVYTYSSDGRVKVAVVISPRFSEFVGGQPFTIEELRTCDPSEYGGTVDLGEQTTVWTHEVTGDVVSDIAGHRHCGWESARLLHVEIDGIPVRQYLRDPLGVFRPDRLDSFAGDVELPDNAAFSGYRTEDGRELWFTDDDRAAYVVTPDGVERWPRARELIGCA